MERALWVSRESESKVPKPVLLASEMHKPACIILLEEVDMVP